MELGNRQYYFKCHVSGCLNSTTNSTKVLFRLPENLQRRSEWLALMQREDLIETTCARVRVCEDHFDPSLIKKCLKRVRLNRHAIPQFLLPPAFSQNKGTQTEIIFNANMQCYYTVQTLVTSNNIVNNQMTLQNQAQSFSGTSASTANSQNVRDIVANVYNYLQAEYEELKSCIGGICDLSPLANILDRTASATGVSEDVVSAIVGIKKRAAGFKRAAAAAKRAKVTHHCEVENASSITGEESSCEEPDDDDDQEQDDDNDLTHDGSQHLIEIEVERLKVEREDEYEYNPLDPLQMSDESTKAWTTEVQTITPKKKTNAQKCREYRERKKLQNAMAQNITAERSDECSETDQLQAKKPKTNAERRKKHYEAQKLKKQQSKKVPKSKQQKNKEYYDRKKKFQALNTSNHHSDAMDGSEQHMLCSSNVGNVPSVSNTTHTEITTQPAVVVYPQSSDGVLPVISVEPISSLISLKTEPDDESAYSGVSCASDTVSETTLSDVKYKPPVS